MGFESASCMETKEFCGAAWPSKELKRKERNSYCPLIAPEKFFISPGRVAFRLNQRSRTTLTAEIPASRLRVGVASTR